jgi:hypothetical protein
MSGQITKYSMGYLMHYSMSYSLGALAGGALVYDETRFGKHPAVPTVPNGMGKRLKPFNAAN